jgi:hypothetical protein
LTGGAIYEQGRKLYKKSGKALMAIHSEVAEARNTSINNAKCGNF